MEVQLRAETQLGMSIYIYFVLTVFSPPPSLLVRELKILCSEEEFLRTQSCCRMVLWCFDTLVLTS
jgi:hypothetical protein